MTRICGPDQKPMLSRSEGGVLIVITSKPFPYFICLFMAIGSLNHRHTHPPVDASFERAASVVHFPAI